MRRQFSFNDHFPNAWIYMLKDKKSWTISDECRTFKTNAKNILYYQICSGRLTFKKFSKIFLGSALALPLRVFNMKFSYENFIWKMRFLSFIFHGKSTIWKHEIFCGSVIWFHDYNETVSPWTNYTVSSPHYSEPQRVQWQCYHLKHRSHTSLGVSDHRDSDQTRWATDIVILFGVDPHRRCPNGWGRGHDETQPAYPLWACGVFCPYPPHDGCRCVLPESYSPR